MKTKFIFNLKQFLFVVVAFLGTFVSYAQSDQNTSQGGSKTPELGHEFDIGDKDKPVSIPKIPDVHTSNIFNYPIVLGGGGRGTGIGSGQLDDDTDPYDIGGGKNTPGDLSSGGMVTNSFIDPDDNARGRAIDIRRRNFVMNPLGYNPGLGCDINTGGKHSESKLFTTVNSGGRGGTSGRGTNTGTGTGEFSVADIGGGKTTTGGDTGQVTIPDFTNDSDTGSRGADIRTGDFALNSLEYIPGSGCIIGIGGRDTGGGLLNGQTNGIGGKSSDTGLCLIVLADIGGRGSGGGRGTSTGGDYDDDDDDTGGRDSMETTGETYVLFSWDSLPN